MTLGDEAVPYRVEVVGLHDWNEENDNIDVAVSFEDGRRYMPTFYTLANIKFLLERFRTTGECRNGLYFFASDMVLVERLTLEVIEASVADLISNGELDAAAARLDGEVDPIGVVVPWEVPISAKEHCSNALKELRLEPSSALVTLIEKETGSERTIRFKKVVAVRSTKEKYACERIYGLPFEGGFFEAEDSLWMREVRQATRPSRHFIIGTCDAIIEVIAKEAEVES